MEIPDIDTFLRYFESVRGRTQAVAACIPPDRVEWEPGPGRYTPGDVVRHIAATERWMWAENAAGRPSRYPGHGPELASGKEEVLAYLESMHAESVAILRTLGAEDLVARCTTVGGAEITVWKWLRAMVEHEVHHRGQLYQILGTLGVAVPPLYGLTEAEVRAASRP